MSPKSPTKVSPEQTLETKDNGDLMTQPKKDMIVEFNGGSEKAKIRTRDGGLNGDDKDLCHKGMPTLMYIVQPYLLFVIFSIPAQFKAWKRISLSDGQVGFCIFSFALLFSLIIVLLSF